MARCLNCMNIFEGLGDECPHCGFIKGTPAKEGFHLNPGVELHERYIVGTVTSYGGFGVVYASWDTILKCKVAIKEYFPTGSVTREPGKTEMHPVNGTRRKEYFRGLERFLLEAKTMSKFEGHPNVVSFMDYFEENGTAYIVMEYLEGVTLKQFAKDEEKLGEKVSIETAVEIAKTVCDSLTSLHQRKIIHRDISPDNIFICADNTIKVIDFGASRLAEKDIPMTKVLKISYAPPEQYASEKEQGEYTDVYALGATLYRVLTGEKPEESARREEEIKDNSVKGDPLVAPRELNPDIPEQLENIILKAMAIAPQMRFQTMQEFKSALEGKTKPLNPEEELKRRKIVRISSILVAVFVIGAGALYGLHLLNNKKEAAKLPASEISVTMQETSEELNQENMEFMLAEYRENYPHVNVAIDIVDVNQATVVYRKDLQEDAVDTLSECTRIYEYIDEKNYYFAEEMQKYIEEYRQIPTGYVEIVLYKKKDAKILSEKETQELLETQNKDGFMTSVEKFSTGEVDYLIAGTDYYYDFFANQGDSEIEINHTVNAGNVEIVPLFENKCFGYFSDFWSINKNATEDEQKCAIVLLAYFLEGNCQRSFFTVENERQSNGAPLQKGVFDTNYYKNITGRKMEFLKDDMKNITFINEFDNIDEYYEKMLEQIQ